MSSSVRKNYKVKGGKPKLVVSTAYKTKSNMEDLLVCQVTLVDKSVNVAKVGSYRVTDFTPVRIMFFAIEYETD
jgi:hypothetical protein